jgi:hypothetical protein
LGLPRVKQKFLAESNASFLYFFNPYKYML